MQMKNDHGDTESTEKKYFDRIYGILNCHSNVPAVSVREESRTKGQNVMSHHCARPFRRDARSTVDSTIGCTSYTVPKLRRPNELILTIGFGTQQRRAY